MQPTPSVAPAQAPADAPVPLPPPAPPQPELPPAGRPTAVSLPDGPLPRVGLPRNAQELRGLRERREILRDQLERANNRRSQLVDELNAEEGETPLPAEARAGVQQRLNVIDERILQIERDQALTERLLSNAPPAVLAQAVSEERRENARVDEDEAVAGAFAAFGGGVLLTLIIGRFRRGFGRRRAANTKVAAAVIEDPRFDRLAQAVDAISEEVERIGEGQRFVTQLLAQRHEAPALRAEALGAEPERR